ncbi:MAG: A/G-specific adenine glycosylase [Desulfocapsaceae bacterium]|nr:A/G-specific adenine glycosylase [Desulfocapsaceae bacterium]
MDLAAVQSALGQWFRQLGRDLPWRKDYIPYHVWISEIMLQQTQMERGVWYFKRWLTRFPDVGAVAAAGEQEILKYWEGLGYYARARNLHKAAKVMVELHRGEVPASYDILLSLPGIGRYTAAAIASIAFNQDVAVVDANVERIFARLYNMETPLRNREAKKRIQQLATELLPAGEARIFNQALMDLGGLVCIPKKPDCANCPLAGHCAALAAGTVAERPVVAAAGKTILITMATGVLEYDGLIFIQQRMADDVWGSLWEFPGGRMEAGETPEQTVVREYREETGFAVRVTGRIATVIHHYMQYKVILHGLYCRLDEELRVPELQAAQDFRWVTAQDLSSYGFPAGHRKLIKYMAESGADGIS